MRRRDALRAGVGLAAVGLGVPGTSARAAAHPGPYQPYGSLDLPGAKEAVVGDGAVYVATTTGYAAVDLAAPDRPELLADVRDPLADREAGPLRGIHDVKVAAGRLLVVGPANPRPGALAGLLVVDVSDPADPRHLGFLGTDHPIHNCAFDGRYAYVTGNDRTGNPLVIVDVDRAVDGLDPAAPGEGAPDVDADDATVGRWSLVDHDPKWSVVPPSVRPLHDVWVRDDTAYLALWDAGTWLLDVSDPTAPAPLGHVPGVERGALSGLASEAARRESIEPPGNHHYVATDPSGDLLAVGRESWATATDREGPGGIDLYDVSDPTAPARLGGIDPPTTPDPTLAGVWTTAHNFELRDGRLYSAWYQGGVKRHDVSDPTAPRELTWWRAPERARFWTARLVVPGTDGYFVASSMGRRDVPARVYAFPDHAGTQADPPGIVGDDAGPGIVTPTRTATPGATRTRTPSPTPTTDDPTGTTGTTPGLGPGAVGAGAAGAGALWWLRRRAGDGRGGVDADADAEDPRRGGTDRED